MHHPKKPKKIHVVFDCPAKFKGSSLNEHLLTGPDMTNELIGVLMHFQKHSIAIMCNVERMFHQFHASEPDRNYLHFLWWENGDMSQEPQDFRMKVHLYGAASSPGCANYGFRSLAKEYEVQYPMASKFVCQNFYVDDGVTSVQSIDDAIRLVQEAMELCDKGGLRLHKFVQEAMELCDKGGLRLHKFFSNDRRALRNIPASERASAVKEVDLSVNALPMETALCIKCSIDEDMFTFSQSPLQ